MARALDRSISSDAPCLHVAGKACKGENDHTNERVLMLVNWSVMAWVAWQHTWWMPQASRSLPKWDFEYRAASSRSMRLVSGTKIVQHRPAHAHHNAQISTSQQARSWHQSNHFTHYTRQLDNHSAVLIVKRCLAEHDSPRKLVRARMPRVRGIPTDRFISPKPKAPTMAPALPVQEQRVTHETPCHECEAETRRLHMSAGQLLLKEGDWRSVQRACSGPSSHEAHQKQQKRRAGRSGIWW
jgi:hypothetical protein